MSAHAIAVTLIQVTATDSNKVTKNRFVNPEERCYAIEENVKIRTLRYYIEDMKKEEKGLKKRT